MNIKDEIIDKLMTIGFNKYEAKVYLTLLESKEITAYEISKRSGVPQSKIYETVRSLVSRGISSMNGSEPIKYSALPLDEFLNSYKSSTETTIDYLKENINNINSAQSSDYIWHFNGKDSIMNKAKAMIKNAKKNIYLSLWAEEYNNLHEDLLDADKKGVHIVSVLYGDIEDKIGKIYYHEMHGMKEDAAVNGRWVSLVADDNECLFAIIKEDDSSSVWTQNKSFMMVNECFITHDIFIAEIYSKHRDELNKEFGYNLEKIRKKLHIG
jgi:HTH-type transcriptional regulator, sugar sensing transcriptional regulator